jgi:hypothetical protein
MYKNPAEIINSIHSDELVYSKHDKNCAPGITFENGSCYSLNVLVKMAEEYNKNNSSDIIQLFPNFETLNRSKYKQYLVKEFKKRLSDVCDSQKCWATHIFIKNMNKIQTEELQKNIFRPSGPQGKFEWLNTININDVMKQYEKKYSDFLWLGAVPIDFDDLTQLKIKSLDFDVLYRNNKTKIGIIFNLDESWKSGSHWVASYANLKEGQVYYFDSYGIPPEHRIRTYMRRVANYYKDNLKINIDANHNKIRHQYGGSECGVYSINFILRLLRGDSFKDICASKIPDKKINKCRKVYFHQI